GGQGPTGARQQPFFASGSGSSLHRGSFDGSREQFVVGLSTKISEVMCSLPFVRVDPVVATAMTTAVPIAVMQAAIRGVDTSITSAIFFDSANPPALLASKLANNPVTLQLARLGLSWNALET